ncbi:non-homologous end joining protein Ku [Candidatus Contubernalis alkaliaceticus]|uniref:non-homologous end joining protein Ku n=1 Tax=Candidatus Contubernalis alkaliaceticus TaxID=338645 RepID=UPI001F4BE7C8|nr:Ku protein [Candidatus Contubernalis alkalaceticus]UNC93391.1 Ku protein [Candidatus Contubernalis alkalaceticus]
MRTIWKGAISFGLVSIPVKLFPATERKEVKFKFLHNKCKSPIKNNRVCSSCQQEVGWDEIIKGYEFETGKYVVFDSEELERFPQGRSKTVDIVDFVNLEEIDPVYFDKTYYMAPGETGEKPYVLLRNIMEETGKIAIARVVIRTRENLAAIRVHNGILTMETMFYPDEVRNTDLVPVEGRGITIHENELKMAQQLVENLASSFDPEKYFDEYRERVLQIIEAKVAGQKIEVPEAPEKAKIVDLMEALRASVQMTEGKEEERAGLKKDKKKKPPQGRKKKEKAGIG